ncbi:MAG: hypothetical protein H0T54_03460 [Geodermatophilaceae bacterium]|nr:hypothetical protein [Geodermatophilaceae bacterium]
MQRLASVRWHSPPPTSVDEELAAYDDGTAWLVVGCSREGTATIGTWSTTPGAAAHAALVAAGDVVVDLLHDQAVPEVAEHIRSAALATAVSTVEFVAAKGAGESVTLAAVGGGTRPVQFELDPDSITVHVEKDGATLAWFEAAPPTTGFVTPEAVGLGGLGHRAEIAPGGFGGVALDVPGMNAVIGSAVAVQVSGWLADGLPDQDLPRRFRVRTVAAGHG